MKGWKKPEIVTLDVKQTLGGGMIENGDGVWTTVQSGVAELGSPS